MTNIQLVELLMEAVDNGQLSFDQFLTIGDVKSIQKLRKMIDQAEKKLKQSKKYKSLRKAAYGST